jgi:hypothetical protein
MKIDESGLEMGIKDWFGGKKSTQIVDTQGNPINSEVQDPSKRNFIKGTAAITGIALAGAHLFPENVEAGENWKGFARRYLKDLPNGFQKDLCQEELLGLAYLYMMNGGRDYGLMRTLLTRNNARSVHSEAVDKSVWFCDTGAHAVAMSTYMWRYPRESISLGEKNYREMENKFYHSFSLMKGIDDFYDQHVRSDGTSNQTEKWIVHSLFSCAEEYPSRGKILAEQYLSSPFNKKVELITDLKTKFGNMSWSNYDKLDRDISGSPGKGPLNNWNRLLNAQWGAFFLTCHYKFSTNISSSPWNRKNSKNKQINNIENIFWNLEYPLKKKIGKYIRGPPNYFS